MEHISEYEEARRRNIERNKQFLQQLGLDSIHSGLKQDASKRQAQARKRKLGEQLSENAQRRRSARIQGVKQVEYDGSIIDQLDELEESDRPTALAARRRQREHQQGSVPTRTTTQRTKRERTSAPQAAPSNPASSRNLNADIELFLTEYLGKPAPEFGKAAVMNLAHAEFTPSFNKFSGVVEWKNCLFLWVNVGGDDYANMFLDKGERLTWFGGSRMYEDTPVTQRLLSTRLNTEPPEAECETVLLFCRLPGEPYTCLGRVRCNSHDFSKLPIQFTWRLIDFDQLSSATGDKSDRSEQFQRLLSAADTS